MTELYLVRHCQASGNVRHLFQGDSDCEVTPCGEKQLECLAQRFADVRYDAVYASPLRRAVQTAEAVDRAGRRSVRIEPLLREISGGAIEGMTFSEIYTRYPALEHTWLETPHLFVAPDGESMRSVYERASRVVEQIFAAHPDQTVVLVSHGALLRCLHCYITGLPFERLNELPWSDNTGVSFVRLRAPQDAEIVYWNDTSHLPPEYNPQHTRISAISEGEEPA